MGSGGASGTCATWTTCWTGEVVDSDAEVASKLNSPFCRCEKNIVIDPTLIHFSYAYCAEHVHGNR